MDNSAYVALSRELTLFRDVDVTASNIANANTQGYKAEHILFNSYLSQDVSSGNTNDLSMPNAQNTYRDTSNGALTSTGGALDVAIQGPGYFMVQTPLGVRYTRDGSFQLDTDGNIVTADGYPVLDNAGVPIQVPDNTRDIKIGSIGNLQVNGEELAVLGVAQFSNPQLLEAAGNNLYKSSVAPTVDPTGNTIVQGAVENSNVQPVAEISHMVTLQHNVADSAKFIEVMYDLQRKTSDAWAQQTSS